MREVLLELTQRLVEHDAKCEELSERVIESETFTDDAEEEDPEPVWRRYDGPLYMLSVWLDEAQGLELRLRTALDDLSASDPRIQGARAAFELERSALMEIEAEQLSLDTILPRRSFSLLCSEIAQDYRADETLFTDDAIDALLAAADSHAVSSMFRKANLVAVHAHRTYVLPASASQPHSCFFYLLSLGTSSPRICTS